MKKMNVYTVLFLLFFVGLWAAAFQWGGKFLLLSMGARLGIAISALLTLCALGMLSRSK